MVKSKKNGDFKVTMEYPDKKKPKTMAFKIEDDYGITLDKTDPIGSAYIISNRPPRNGKNGSCI